VNRMTRDQMAARVAREIPEGAYVNLGIGLPTKVANTDLGVFDVGPQGAQVLEIVEGLTLDELRPLTGVKLDMVARSQAA